MKDYRVFGVAMRNASIYKRIVTLIQILPVSFLLFVLWNVFLGHSSLLERKLGEPLVARRKSPVDHDSSPGNHLLFVIGNGRTGTNWIGDILLSHPSVMGSNEMQPEFGLTVELAVSPSEKTEWNTLFHELIAVYTKREAEVVASRKKYFSDKSHPAIWFAGSLQKAFPKAHFIGINRCLYPTVASCLKHRDVQQWFQKFNSSKDNRFLGISSSNFMRYHSLPIHVKCAIRWVAHQRQFETLGLEEFDKSRFHALNYTDLQKRYDQELSVLQDFLSLPSPFSKPPSPVPYDPQKWKSAITASMRRDIDREMQTSGAEKLVQRYCEDQELA